jgi:hypothetical protein
VYCRVPALPKKNPEAGALGAPVRRLFLTGRWGSGDLGVVRSCLTILKLASPPGQ